MALERAAAGASRVLVFEVNAGQMVEDVRLALPDRSRIAGIGGVSFDDSGLRYGTLMDVPEIRARVMGVLGKERIA